MSFEVANGNFLPEIVFEDEYLMVINKPRGLICEHGAGVKDGETLQDWLNSPFDKGGARRAGDFDVNLDRGGIVHRLDKNTAGLMIVAKTVDAQNRLSDMMRAHSVKRTYIGICEGRMHGDGVVDKPLIRNPKNRTTYVTAAPGTPNSRDAVTRYRVLEVFRNHSIVEFNLETGRTHQIRVHMKSLSHPLVGDPEYNKKSTVARGVGQMLESVALEFTHPITGERLSFKINTTPLFNEIRRKIAVK